MWYYLDPDNNKKNPKTGVFCARCKKKFHPLKGHTGYSNIIIQKDSFPPVFRIAGAFERADGLIGNDCLEYVIKEYGEQ